MRRSGLVKDGPAYDSPPHRALHVSFPLVSRNWRVSPRPGSFRSPADPVLGTAADEDQARRSRHALAGMGSRTLSSGRGSRSPEDQPLMIRGMNGMILTMVSDGDRLQAAGTQIRETGVGGPRSRERTAFLAPVLLDAPAAPCPILGARWERQAARRCAGCGGRSRS